MLQRCYHSYDKWECFKWGMYDKTCFMDERKIIDDCKNLLSCPEWLYEAMSFVSHEWFYSCEQHLSNTNRNRQAFLGQAACNMVHGAPEYLTKIAWNELTEERQEKANKIADDVIDIWEQKFKRGYFRWQKLESEKMCSKQHKSELN